MSFCFEWLCFWNWMVGRSFGNYHIFVQALKKNTWKVFFLYGPHLPCTKLEWKELESLMQFWFKMYSCIMFGNEHYTCTLIFELGPCCWGQQTFYGAIVCPHTAKENRITIYLHLIIFLLFTSQTEVYYLTCRISFVLSLSVCTLWTLLTCLLIGTLPDKRGDSQLECGLDSVEMEWVQSLRGKGSLKSMNWWFTCLFHLNEKKKKLV